MPCIIISNLLVYLYVYVEYFGQEIRRGNIPVLRQRLRDDEMTCSEESINTAIKEMLYLRTKAW